MLSFILLMQLLRANSNALINIIVGISSHDTVPDIFYTESCSALFLFDPMSTELNKKLVCRLLQNNNDVGLFVPSHLTVTENFETNFKEAVDKFVNISGIYPYYVYFQSSDNVDRHKDLAEKHGMFLVTSIVDLDDLMGADSAIIKYLTKFDHTMGDVIISMTLPSESKIDLIKQVLNHQKYDLVGATRYYVERIKRGMKYRVNGTVLKEEDFKNYSSEPKIKEILFAAQEEKCAEKKSNECKMRHHERREEANGISAGLLAVAVLLFASLF